ncbi:MAG: threonine--tRNA ligase [Candidatus Komeilibacteria bacterium]|nr:threonine--tRNA ligase [Candidatus Komeilibacteria bacterium]
MNQEQLEQLRHSLAHLLAAAVLKIRPEAKRTIGPAIDNGFYYDFEFAEPLTQADLPKIEKQMKKMLTTWKSFDKHEVSAAEAKKEFADNPYKLELINEFAGEGQNLTIYQSGDFRDLCRGGHAENFNKIDPASFKLEKVAGAYWRGSEKNTMLTRIYGLAFATKQELDDYLAMKAEAEKRDHKKLGPALDLFTFSELVGSGLPLWTPKGTILRNLLDDFVWELRKKYGYEKVEIPHITKKDLYETSGHWDKFQDDLFKITTREGHLFAMKPMNCPHHTQIYARRAWSYRDLPQRYATTTMCYRDEQSGELAGLSRVRGFAQDDAHVFCRLGQVKKEFLKIWDIIHAFYGVFGFNLRIRVSVHDPEQPEKYLGDKKKWEFAESMLNEIVNEKKADTFLGVGEAAFYGPKLDFMGKDSLGREWQVATIQIDMNMPERFDLNCTNEEGKAERVVMVHAAIMGSIERFLSIIIEHFAGEFPLWLSPVQVKIINVGEVHEDYCQKLADQLKAENIRVELDLANETVGNKIRKSSREKIPYTLVIGDKEMQADKLAIRVRGQENLAELSYDDFITNIKNSINNRSAEL